MRYASVVDSGASLLVVDDDALYLEAFARALRRTGLAHPVVTARDGRDALEYLTRQGPYAQASAAQAVRPGLIFLDLRMPRMNGIEFLEARREHPGVAPIPAIVLSTSRRSADWRRCFDLGVAGYLSKDVDEEGFAEVLRTAIAYWRLSLSP